MATAISGSSLGHIRFELLIIQARVSAVLLCGEEPAVREL